MDIHVRFSIQTAVCNGSLELEYFDKETVIFSEVNVMVSLCLLCCFFNTIDDRYEKIR